MLWHPLESAKTPEIAFRALLTGGASEMELVLVKRLALRASSQGCVHEVVSEFRWESPTRTRDICRMYQPYNQE